MDAKIFSWLRRRKEAAMRCNYIPVGLAPEDLSRL
jgi:hypothetical protein